MSRVSDHQPAPVRTDGACIQDLVIADLRGRAFREVADDIEARKQVGIERYGTVLQAHNGRDALLDAYQEALDLSVYLRQAVEEATSDGARTTTRYLYSHALDLCANLKNAMRLRP